MVNLSWVGWGGATGGSLIYGRVILLVLLYLLLAMLGFAGIYHSLDDWKREFMRELYWSATAGGLFTLMFLAFVADLGVILYAKCKVAFAHNDGHQSSEGATTMNLHYRLLDAVHEAIPYELLLLADPSQAMIDDYIFRGQCSLAFNENNELVGEFVLLPTHPKTVEIVNIAVKEEHQGKGIGKELVARAIEEASRLGAKSVEIGTGNSSLPQLKLYQRCGFRIVGIDPDFFVRHYADDIIEDGIPCRDMIRLRIDLQA